MREWLAFLPYVWRTVARARVRSLGTIVGTALALVLFTFVRLVGTGTTDLVEGSARPLLVVFQDARFCPMQSTLPVRYARTIAAVPGVASVLATVVFVNACRSNLDLVTLHGVPRDGAFPTYDLEVVAGAAAPFETRSDSALVGERLAARRGLEPGQRARLGPVDVEVVAIVRSANADVANLAFVDIDQLALARERQGTATQFVVRLTGESPPETVAREIDARFRTDEARTDTSTMQAFVAAAVAEIEELVGFARWLGWVGVAIVGLLVANTVQISAEARAGEMAVLETLGMSGLVRAGLIVTEGVLLAVAGGTLGAVAVSGALWIWPLTIGIEGHGIDVAPSFVTVLEAVGTAAVLGVVASLAPAIATVRRPLWSAIRSD